jgi:hypothetical protein
MQGVDIITASERGGMDMNSCETIGIFEGHRIKQNNIGVGAE